jgi:hypothetical protein
VRPTCSYNIVAMKLKREDADKTHLEHKSVPRYFVDIVTIMHLGFP